MAHKREARELLEELEDFLNANDETPESNVEVRIGDFNHRGDGEGDVRFTIAADPEDQARVQEILNFIEFEIDGDELGEFAPIVFDDQFPGSPGRIQDVFRLDVDLRASTFEEGVDLTDIGRDAFLIG